MTVFRKGKLYLGYWLVRQDFIVSKGYQEDGRESCSMLIIFGAEPLHQFKSTWQTFQLYTVNKTLAGQMPPKKTT